MGDRNFKVDIVEFFANIMGEFFKVVHYIPHDPGRRCYFCPDYPTCPLVPCNGRRVSFFLKSFFNGYR